MAALASHQAADGADGADGADEGGEGEEGEVGGRRDEEGAEEGAEGEQEGEQKGIGDGDDDGDAASDAVVDGLVSMVMWYKSAISPLLAPACRFYPTCSSYAIASLQEYGPLRGLVLTAWRLLRCNPTGGKGYDQPIWPPPSYFAGGKFPDRPP